MTTETTQDFFAEPRIDEEPLPASRPTVPDTEPPVDPEERRLELHEAITCLEKLIRTKTPVWGMLHEALSLFRRKYEADYGLFDTREEPKDDDIELTLVQNIDFLRYTAQNYAIEAGDLLHRAKKALDQARTELED